MSTAKNDPPPSPDPADPSDSFPESTALRAENARLQQRVDELESAAARVEATHRDARDLLKDVAAARQNAEELNRNLQIEIRQGREREAKMQRQARLIDLSFEPIFVWDLDGGIVEWNAGAERLYGYTREEALGRASHELLKTMRLVSLAEFRAALQRDGQWTGELRHISKDGREIIADSRHQLVEMDGRRLVLETIRDITEGKRASESLRQSEEELRRAVEEAPIPVIMQAEDGQVLQISRTWTELTGFSAEEFSNLEAWLTRADGEGAAAVHDHMEELFKGSRRSLNIDFPIQTRRGEVRHWSFSASAPGTLSDGRRFIVGMAVDITARRSMETALRESEERFRQFAENSSDVFWILNAGTRQLEYLNPVYEKMFGESREPILRDIERWTELIHPEDRDLGSDMFERLAAGENVTVDYRIIRPNDGAIRWIRDSGFPIRDSDGTIKRLAGVLQDVTADKERTDAVRESEKRFRAVANLVPDLLWSLTPKGAVDWINQRWIEYTGQSAEEAAGEGWFKTIHPDDLEGVTRELNAALVAGRAMRHEQRIRSASGDYRWFLVRKEPFRDDRGQVARWFAAASDIHEQRTAWDALRESEERFRYLVEGARDYAIFMLDPSNIIVHWNTGAERVFGWTAEEAVGRSGRIVFTPEDRKNKQEEKEIATAMRDGEAPDKRWHLRKDGSRIWVDGVMHRVDDPETGALRGFAKIARDATPEHQAQEELERRVQERTADLTAANRKLKAEIEERTRLEQELLLVSEREKRRIGQDLHDSLCQELAAAAFFLESTAQKFGKRNPVAARSLTESARIVNDNIALARNLARGLHPIELATDGLAAALRELCYRVGHTGKIQCRVECPKEVRIRDDAVALNLYRIAQEAVTNAIKHGSPREISISLKRTRSSLVLQVQNDGTDFPPNRSGKGMGLHIMRHRANVISALFEIKAREGGGTIVTCTLPGE